MPSQPLARTLDEYSDQFNGATLLYNVARANRAATPPLPPSTPSTPSTPIYTRRRASSTSRSTQTPVALARPSAQPPVLTGRASRAGSISSSSSLGYGSSSQGGHFGSSINTTTRGFTAPEVPVNRPSSRSSSPAPRSGSGSYSSTRHGEPQRFATPPPSGFYGGRPPSFPRPPSRQDSLPQRGSLGSGATGHRELPSESTSFARGGLDRAMSDKQRCEILAREGFGNRKNLTGALTDASVQELVSKFGFPTADDLFNWLDNNFTYMTEPWPNWKTRLTEYLYIPPQQIQATYRASASVQNQYKAAQMNARHNLSQTRPLGTGRR